MRYPAKIDFLTRQPRCATAALLLVVAAGFLIVGVNRGEVATVFNKAIHICMECIGLG